MPSGIGTSCAAQPLESQGSAVKAEHQLDVLDRRSGGALAEVVEPGDEYGLAVLLVGEDEKLERVGARSRPRPRAARDELGTLIVSRERSLQVSALGLTGSVSRCSVTLTSMPWWNDRDGEAHEKNEGRILAEFATPAAAKTLSSDIETSASAICHTAVPKLIWC